MSTSIIYHGFGAAGYQYKKTEYLGGKIYFTIEKHERRCTCPCSCLVIQKGMRERVIQTVPIGEKPVFFRVENRRLLCSACGALRFEDLGISEPKKQYDRKLERYVADLCRLMTIKDVALHVGLCWDTVKEIDRKRLEREKPTAFQSLHPQRGSSHVLGL
ncbi:MAG: helix-turn-helix domain-containing protein [Candidatus Glassbacteria bacterium]